MTKYRTEIVLFLYPLFLQTTSYLIHEKLNINNNSNKKGFNYYCWMGSA